MGKAEGGFSRATFLAARNNLQKTQSSENSLFKFWREEAEDEGYLPWLWNQVVTSRARGGPVCASPFLAIHTEPAYRWELGSDKASSRLTLPSYRSSLQVFSLYIFKVGKHSKSQEGLRKRG